MRIALVGLGKTGKFAARYFAEKNIPCTAFCRDPRKYEAAAAKLGVETASVDHLAERLRSDRTDVLIDFSRAEFLRRHVEEIADAGVHIVTAITEYARGDIDKFKQITEEKRIGFIIAPNITYGINIMMYLMKRAAILMSSYDFEIIEEHHNQKKDIPSGTAKKMAADIDAILGKRCDCIDKITPVHSIRSGGLIGKHKLIAAGKYDKIEITHESFSRMAFAEGAHKAAEFIREKVGFYEMEDLFAEKLKEVSLK